MQYLLLTIILFPLFQILSIKLRKKHRIIFKVISVLLPIVNIGLLVFLKIDTQIVLLPNLLTLNVDKFSWFFLLIVNIVWLFTQVYLLENAQFHFRGRTNNFHKYISLLLPIIMITGAAGDLITLFVFYAIGIPITYPILVLRDNHESRRAARNFVYQTMIPALLIFLPAIIITYSITGSLALDELHSVKLSTSQTPILFVSILLLMFILGISKNCLIPFHKWLPGLKETPAPVTALVHSVAAVKSGSIAIIKICYYVFGMDLIHDLTANIATGGYLFYLAGITAVYTAYLALKSKNIKERFAYSTVGQLSYIMIAILLGTQNGLIAATLHILTHSISKACLFYTAGYYSIFYDTTSTNRIAQIAPHTKFVVFVIAICGLSIAGLPFLAGSHSKDLMLVEAYNNGLYAACFFLLIGSVINLLYIYPIIKAAFFTRAIDMNIESEKVPVSMKIVFIIIVVFNLLSGYFMNLLI